MIGPCPYPCSNKTDFGYCQTTGCIHPVYMQFQVGHIPDYSNNPCAACLNNPANGGSGVCHCVLGGAMRF